MKSFATRARRRALICSSAVVLAAALSQAPAMAGTPGSAYDVTFTGPGGVTGTAVITVNGANSNGVQVVNYATGTITGPSTTGTSNITGLSPYAGADNSIYSAGVNPISLAGLSFSTTTNGFNLSGVGLATYLNTQSLNSTGSLGVGAPGSIALTNFTLTVHASLDTNGIYNENSGPITGQSTVVFNGGTFQPTSGFSGAPYNGVLGAAVILNGDGTAANAGTVDTTNANVTFAGKIQGSGGLTITGSNGAYFTANNTYTGVTTIDSGSWLSIGDDGTSGSVAGNITNNGTLYFYRTDSTSYGGVISGTGDVNAYTGTVTLTGVNTYSGSTTIGSSGTSATLALKGAGSIASSSGVFEYANSALDISQTTSGASIQSLSGSASSAVMLGSKTLTLTNANGTYAGVIQDGGLGGGTGGGLDIVSGTETLTGVNTYTGVTTIGSPSTSATLVLKGSGSIANSSVVDNGIFDISQTNSGASVQSLSGSTLSIVDLGSKTLTLTNANGTYAGVIQDGIGGGTGGGLTISGGTETLTGVNTYTGATTIESATLALKGAGSIAGSSGVSVIDGGVFDISQTTSGASIKTLSGSISSAVNLGSKTLTLTNANGTYAGVIQDGGIVDGTGGGLDIVSGTETLTGVNTYTGVTTIGSPTTSATLVLKGSGSIANSSVVDDGIFDISQTTSGASIQSLSGSTLSIVDLGSKTLTLTNANGTYAGVIQDGLGGGTGGGLTISGGTETLTGVNTYTGATTINSATLALKGAGSIATSSGVVDNGIFDISQTTSGASIKTLSGSTSSAVNLGSKTLTLTSANGTYAGVIADGGIGGGKGGGLTIAGGTETLTGANTYTGLTTIDIGAKLVLSGAGSIANSSVADNGTFDISAVSSGTSSIQSLSGSGLVNLGANSLVLTNAAGTFSGTFSAPSAGAGSVEIAGGTETVTGGNTIGGKVTIDKNATLAWGDGSGVASLIGGGTSAPGVVDNGTLVINWGNTSLIPGAVAITGSGSLVMQSGYWADLGGTAYTGATTIDSGATLLLAGPASLASSSGVTDNGTLDVSMVSAPSIKSLSGSGTVSLGSQTLTLTSASGTFGGVIADGGFGGGTGGGLTLVSGTETLNGVNTYTGLTTITGGVLEIGDAGHATASLAGAVTVGAAGTLMGHGTIHGAVTNTAGGVVAPGGTIGTLTVGSYTQGSTSTLAIEVAPTQASQLNSLGAASLAGTLALSFDAGTYGPHIYEIVAGAPITGTFSTVTTSGLPTGVVEGLTYASGQVDLVAEPTAPATVYGGISTATLNRAQSFASLVEDSFGAAGCADGSTAKPGQSDACHGMRAWAQVIGSTDHVGAVSGGAGFGFNNKGAGFIGGIDKRWGDGATLGAAFGYADNDFAMNGALSSASGHSYFGSVYGRWSTGPVQLDGQGYYMRTEWPLNRVLTGYGTASSNPNGDSFGFLAQASTQIGESGVHPYLRFGYSHFSRDATTETGVGPLDFDVLAGSAASSLGEAGLIYSPTNVELSGHPVLPSLRVGVQQEFANRNVAVSASLVGVSGANFTVDYLRPERTTGVADASVKIGLTPSFDLTGEVRGRFGSQQSEGVASVGGAFRF